MVPFYNRHQDYPIIISLELLNAHVLYNVITIQMRTRKPLKNKKQIGKKHNTIIYLDSIIGVFFGNVVKFINWLRAHLRVQ